MEQGSFPTYDDNGLIWDDVFMKCDNIVIWWCDDMMIWKYKVLSMWWCGDLIVTKVVADQQRMMQFQQMLAMAPALPNMTANDMASICGLTASDVAGLREYMQVN